MILRSILVVPLIALVALVADPARACGGWGGYSLVDPLYTASYHTDGWLYEEAYWEGSGESVTRFLHTFRSTNPEGTAALEEALGWSESTEAREGPSARIPEMTGAIAAGDLVRAEAIAREIVEGVADLPVPLAEAHTDALRLAVELLEVRPLLKKAPPAATAAYFAAIDAPPPAALAAAARVRTTAPDPNLKAPKKHPRAGSIAWLAIRGKFAALPDGWTAEEVRDATPGALSVLQADLDTWLARYPNHPLTPWARLKKVRLHYLMGESDAAWAILFDLYTAHPERITNEMRFMIRQGQPPSAVAWDRVPPEVAGALITEVAYDEGAWNLLWRKTEASPDAPWALALQERLLFAATRGLGAGQPIPTAFPKQAANPSLSWSRLRLTALLDAGFKPEALAQLEVMRDDLAFTAPMVARLAIERGDWLAAVRTPELDPATVQYLIRVILPDAVVGQLVNDANPDIRWEARLSLATRTLEAGGGWAAGATILDPVDPGRAALWRQADGLSRDRSQAGVLKYARFLRQHAGKIFIEAGGGEMDWYRSLPLSEPPKEGGWMRPQVQNWPTPAEEWELTQRFLKRNFATWKAVEQYAVWLNGAGVGSIKPGSRAYTEAMSVLTETDAAYNNLLNYGSYETYAWGHLAPSSQPAKDIRRAGKVLWAL